MPFSPDIENHKLNIGVLYQLLNSGLCFDVVLDIHEHDILELHFTCQGQKLVYAYEFKHSYWELTDYDPFGNADKVEMGKIEDPAFSLPVTLDS